MVRWVARIAAVLALVFIIAGTLAHFAARRVLERRQAALLTDYRKLSAKFVADLAQLDDSELFAKHPGPDAAPLLSKYVRWNVRDPKPVTDLSWMATLKDYGFWELDQVGFVPNREDALGFAQQRLGLALAAGDAREAGAEVHEFARLAVSTETWWGVWLARDLLRAEVDTLMEAKRLGQPVEGWAPPVELNRLGDAPAFAVAMRSLLATEEMTTDALGVMECVALSSAADEQREMQLYVRRGLRDRYELLATQIRASTCRLTHARAFLEHPEAGPHYVVSTTAWCGLNRDYPPCELPQVPLGWMPFVRFPLGVRSLTSFPTDAFSAYR